MRGLSQLDEVAKEFDVHENSTRIKKLIFGACYNTWENDLNKLERFPFHYLLQQLFQLNPSLEHLNSSLNKVVQTLNKPGEYTLIANIIISKLQKAYLENRATQVVTSETGAANPVQAKSEQKSNQQEDSFVQPLKAPYDPFNLRLEIMRYTNPLRAKILVYSTLYQQLDISEKDLTMIRSHEFDDLIEDLFYYCEKLTELEARLGSTARCLFEEEENYQAASAIVQALKPFYANRQPGMYKRPPKVVSNVTQAVTLGLEFEPTPPKINNRNLNDNEENTYQVNKS